MSVHHYPDTANRGDLTRGVIGLVLTGAPFLLVSPHWAVGVLLGACFLVFAAFTARTLIRARTSIELAEDGIVERGPWGRAISWPDLAELKLRYFSTRRDRQGGWMVLTVRGPSGTIKVESTIDGFEQITEAAAEAAQSRRLPLNDTTLNNLAAMGMIVPGTSEGGEAESGDEGESWVEQLARERRDGQEKPPPDR